MRFTMLLAAFIALLGLNACASSKAVPIQLIRVPAGASCQGVVIPNLNGTVSYTVSEDSALVSLKDWANYEQEKISK